MFHWYGLIIGIAIVVGWWWADRLWRRLPFHHIHFDTIGIWAVIGGVIGARLYHVLDYGWYYRIHPLEAAAVWQGGLAIWGAVIGGVIALLFFSWRKHVPLLLLLDVSVAALPLSQAIGRWGNWVNLELYGKPTTLPWGWWIPPAYRPEGMMETAYYHPLFLYESLLSLGLFFFIHYWGRRRLAFGLGAMVGLYLVGYGLIRFGLEPLRLTSWSIFDYPVAQGLSLVSILIGIGLLVRVRLEYEKETISKTK